MHFSSLNPTTYGSHTLQHGFAPSFDATQAAHRHSSAGDFLDTVASAGSHTAWIRDAARRPLAPHEEAQAELSAAIDFAIAQASTPVETAERALRRAAPGTNEELRALLNAVKMPGMPRVLQLVTRALQLAAPGSSEAFEATLAAAHIPGPHQSQALANTWHLAGADSDRRWHAMMAQLEAPVVPAFTAAVSDSHTPDSFSGTNSNLQQAEYEQKARFSSYLAIAKTPGHPRQHEFALRAVAAARPASRDRIRAALACARIPGLPGREHAAADALYLAQPESYDRLQALVSAAYIAGMPNRRQHAREAVRLAARLGKEIPKNVIEIANRPGRNSPQTWNASA